MNRKTTTKTANGLALIVLATLALYLPAPARADDPAAPAPDTSKWKCKFCQFEEGRSALLDLGLGYVSEDSYKFGEYNGLEKQGAYLVGNGTARYRGEDAAYLDLSATNLGLDTRRLNIEGGKQGQYKLFLKYAELPHNITDTALTPFLGTGGSNLSLPLGWDRTAPLNTLNANLHGVDLDTVRKRIDLGGSLIPVTHWEYAVNVRHETKDGQRGTAGTFIFNAAQLVQPIDYTTDQVDISAAYNGAKLQGKLAYYGSNFNNSDASLTWQNPYLPPGSQPDKGQLALPPSNQFHQIVLSSGYSFTDRTRAMGEVAVGRMTQDESFLPATTNASLPAITLPRGSLDGQVDTLTANLKVVSAPIDPLRLTANYSYNDRNNKTPQSTYQWVSTDTTPNIASGNVTNQPYSFTRNVLNLSADYKLPKYAKLGAGYDDDTYKRDLQDIDRTSEQTWWGKISGKAGEMVDMTLKYAHATRDVSTFSPNPAVQPPENPLMRKYDMADRDRNAVRFRAGVTPIDRLSLGMGLDYAWDNYSQSVIGLLDGVQRDINGDASLMLTDKASLSFFASHEQINSSQGGSQAVFNTQDWSARNQDTSDTAGLGMKYRASEKLDLGADYSATRTTGEISVSDFTNNHAGQPFPDLTTKLDTVKIYGTYKLQPKVALHAAYWYERYDSTDWAIDGVTPYTLPTALTFGQLSPSYHVNVVTMSVRYSF